MRLRARDHYTSSTLIGRKGGADPSFLHTTFSRHQESKWMQDGCKPTWHRMDHVPWLLELFSKTTSWREGLTQNRETVALQILTTICFILFYHGVRACAWIEIHWNSIWLTARSHMTSHDTWGSVTTPHDFGGVLGRFWTLCCGLSQFRGHGSWLVREVALNPRFHLLDFTNCLKWRWLYYSQFDFLHDIRHLANKKKSPLLPNGQQCTPSLNNCYATSQRRLFVVAWLLIFVYQMVWAPALPLSLVGLQY